MGFRVSWGLYVGYFQGSFHGSFWGCFRVLRSWGVEKV